ncbi:hypothetical protein [Lentzea sp. NPDC004782]|uniref:hypothetical protein n=1 Tax=Lentzea sp. NPDC004782 TaxID=3154458 RepID=UPI0033A11AD1
MLSRTVVGACAGALAATGWALTLDALPRYYYLKPGRIGCGRSSVLLYPLTFSFWMLAAVLVTACAAYAVAAMAVGRPRAC